MQPKVLFICIGIHQSQTEGSRSLCAGRRRGGSRVVVDVVARQKRSHTLNVENECWERSQQTLDIPTKIP
ncbi:hypothetical protein H6F78_08980 [Coleofasciculus sp. FACHB-64]|nr:hypothetical protein [Coleofasciculus sp. FACHB-64]